MSAPISTLDGQPLVGAYGDVYTAPPGTEPPADFASIAAPWTLMGLVSEEGATWTLPTEETTDIKAWQSPYPVRRLTTSLDTSVAFKLMEWDRIALPFVLGGGTFTEEGETVIFHPPKAGEAESKAIFLYVKDADIEFGIYMAKGRVTEREDAVFRPDEAALLGVTFGIEVTDPTQDPYQLIFKAENLPPEGTTPSTTATAGIPGSFNGVPPANLAAMAGITAIPATAWTIGQYVVLGDASHAYWDSDSWNVGEAPVIF